MRDFTIARQKFQLERGLVIAIGPLKSVIARPRARKVDGVFKRFSRAL